MTIGERIKKLRIKLDIKAEDLAEILGVSRATIYRYESEDIKKLPVKVLEPLAKALKTTPAYLMGWEETPNFKEESIIDIDNVIPITAMLPIYGCIPAGVPAFAEEHIEGYLPTCITNPEEYFYLRVQGDSMIGAGITSGSKVLIHKQNTADDGQIVACRVNGDEATLKRFKNHGSVILLKPENSAYDDRIIPIEDFESGAAQILGVVKQVLIDM